MLVFSSYYLLNIRIKALCLWLIGERIDHPMKDFMYVKNESILYRVRADIIIFKGTTCINYLWQKTAWQFWGSPKSLYVCSRQNRTGNGDIRLGRTQVLYADHRSNVKDFLNLESSKSHWILWTVKLHSLNNLYKRHWKLGMDYKMAGAERDFV